MRRALVAARDGITRVWRGERAGNGLVSSSSVRRHASGRGAPSSQQAAGQAAPTLGLPPAPGEAPWRHVPGLGFIRRPVSTNNGVMALLFASGVLVGTWGDRALRGQELPLVEPLGGLRAWAKDALTGELAALDAERLQACPLAGWTKRLPLQQMQGALSRCDVSISLACV